MKARNKCWYRISSLKFSRSIKVFFLRWYDCIARISANDDWLSLVDTFSFCKQCPKYHPLSQISGREIHSPHRKKVLKWSTYTKCMNQIFVLFRRSHHMMEEGVPETLEDVDVLGHHLHHLHPLPPHLQQWHPIPNWFYLRLSSNAFVLEIYTKGYWENPFLPGFKLRKLF